MKSYLKLLTIILLGVILTTPILSQAVNEELTKQEEDMLFEEDRPAELQNTSQLTVSFEQGIQSTISKKVTFYMIITSKIATDRLQVVWTVDGVSRVINEKDLTKTFTVGANETIRIPITIKPTQLGVTEVRGVARIIGVDGNAIATVRKNFASNQSGEILPITSDYQTAQFIYYATTLLFGVIFLILLGVIGFILLRRAVAWYNTD